MTLAVRVLSLAVVLGWSTVAQAGDFVMDTRGTRTLRARLLPMLERSDAPARRRVSLEVDGKLRPWAFDAEAIRLARLLPEDRVAVVRADGTLVVVDGDGKISAPIAEDVQGPIAVGRARIAFATGPLGDATIRVHDLVGGQTRQVRGARGSVWSPALSGDDRRLAYVSTREGRIVVVWRALDDKSPARSLALPAGAPFPESSLWAPALSEHWLHFRRGPQQHRIDLRGATP